MEKNYILDCIILIGWILFAVTLYQNQKEKKKILMKEIKLTF